MKRLVWCNLLLLHYCIVLSSAEEHSWSINPIHIPGLVCDSLGFHFTVYPNGRKPNSVKLTALDKQGGAHVLSSRRDCGTWISRRPGGSLTLHAFYNGCYVYEENDENVMTILVKKEHKPGTWILPQTKVLRCPKLREKRAIEEAASNKTILVSSQGVLYFPIAQETETSGNGSPELAGPLDKEWARVILVVCVLAALVVGVYMSKRLCKMYNVKYHVQTSQ